MMTRILFKTIALGLVGWKLGICCSNYISSFVVVPSLFHPLDMLGVCVWFLLMLPAVGCFGDLSQLLKDRCWLPKWFVIAGLLSCADRTALGATEYYILPGGTGSANGSDWNNAATNLPATLVRDTTYWIGCTTNYNFGRFQHAEANSGTARITIKKAIESAHGTDTGWTDTYAAGSAVFLYTGSDLNAHTMGNSGSDYWTIDGQKGSIHGGTNYGICFWADHTTPQVFNIGPSSKGGHNTILRYVYFGGHMRDVGTNHTASPTQNAALTSWQQASNVLVQYCFISGGSTLVDSVPNWTIEYCDLQGSVCDDNPSGAHANVAYVGYGTTNWTFRFNTVWNYNDEGIFFTGFGGSPRNCYVYGNYFRSHPTARFARGVEFRQEYNYTNLYVYNNTFVDLNLFGIKDSTVNGLNSTYDCAVENNLAYNTTIETRSISSTRSNVVVTSDVFVNRFTNDLRLVTGSNVLARVSLGGDFDLTRYGTNYATGGSIGAFDLGTGGGGSATTKAAMRGPMVFRGAVTVR